MSTDRQWIGILYFALGGVFGWFIHTPAPPQRAESPPEYLQGDPRSQVTINSRLETLLEADQESIAAFAMEIDKQRVRLDEMKKSLSERDTRIDELELRVRGMQMGQELRARAEQRKDGGR